MSDPSLAAIIVDEIAVVFDESCSESKAQFNKRRLLIFMTSCWNWLGSEMGTCGTLGHDLEVAIAHTSYMRGA